MFTRFALVSALSLVAFATTAHGAGLPVPTVEYSADRVMETEAGTFEGKVYAAKAQAQSGGQPAEAVEITEVGSDTIEGEATTKYKLIMNDGSAGGFMWFTKDGILMKMDSVVKNGRDKSRGGVFSH